MHEPLEYASKCFLNLKKEYWQQIWLGLVDNKVTQLYTHTHTHIFLLNKSSLYIFSPTPVDMKILAYFYLTMAFTILLLWYLETMASSHMLN